MWCLSVISQIEARLNARSLEGSPSALAAFAPKNSGALVNQMNAQVSSRRVTPIPNPRVPPHPAAQRHRRVFQIAAKWAPPPWDASVSRNRMEQCGRSVACPCIPPLPLPAPPVAECGRDGFWLRKSSRSLLKY